MGDVAAFEQLYRENVDRVNMTRSACKRRFLATIGAVISQYTCNYGFGDPINPELCKSKAAAGKTTT